MTIKEFAEVNSIHDKVNEQIEKINAEYMETLASYYELFDKFLLDNGYEKTSPEYSDNRIRCYDKRIGKHSVSIFVYPTSPMPHIQCGIAELLLNGNDFYRPKTDVVSFTWEEAYKCAEYYLWHQEVERENNGEIYTEAMK